MCLIESQHNIQCLRAKHKLIHDGAAMVSFDGFIVSLLLRVVGISTSYKYQAYLLDIFSQYSL